MKSLLTSLIVIATVVSANALSFSWGLGPDRVQFPAGNFIMDGSVNAYLVYLGPSAAADYSIDGYGLSNLTMDTGASTATGFPTSKGKIIEEFNQTYGTVIGTGDTYGNGSTFGLLLTHSDGVAMWSNLAANTYTVSGAADDGSVLDSAVFTFDWSQNAPGEGLTSGGGWAVVPEPATAALALAGLAMLIRRRK